MTGFNEAQHPRTSGGEFATKTHSDPGIALTATPLCTEGCGKSAEYRFGNVPRGYRTTGAESVFCPEHAAGVAAEGRPIESLPRPQVEGETLVWVVEGDDHEYEIVEADSEDAAIDIAAELFEDRYGDDDEEGSTSDFRDFLVIAGAFRGDIDETDDLEFVPHGDTDENSAYGHLDNL